MNAALFALASLSIATSALAQDGSDAGSPHPNFTTSMANVVRVWAPKPAPKPPAPAVVERPAPSSVVVIERSPPVVNVPVGIPLFG